MKIQRRHFQWLISVVAALTFVPVVGQWFIAVADELGWYKHPIERAAVVLRAINASPLFHWVSGLMIGFAVGVWVGAWQRKQPLHAAVGGTSGAAANLPGKIEILSAPGAPYEISAISGSRRNSTVSIGIRNAGEKPLSNIRVSIENIAPAPPHYHGERIVLGDAGFSLRNDDTDRIVNVATHWEHTKKYRFLEAAGGGWAEALRFMDDDVERNIVVRVAAAETSASTMFKIWLDDLGTLRLQRVADA